MTDLFGMETPTTRIHTTPEAAALVDVLRAFHAHPAVCWCERMNSGFARFDNWFIRLGFVGCPDVFGQWNNVRILDVKLKATKGKLRPRWTVFPELTYQLGGIWFEAQICVHIQSHLSAWKGQTQ